MNRLCNSAGESERSMIESIFFRPTVRYQPRSLLKYPGTDDVR